MVEVEPGVIEKLVLFSIALVILPLGVLLASIHGFFDGKGRPCLLSQMSGRISRKEGHTPLVL